MNQIHRLLALNRDTYYHKYIMLYLNARGVLQVRL